MVYLIDGLISAVVSEKLDSYCLLFLIKRKLTGMSIAS